MDPEAQGEPKPVATAASTPITKATPARISHVSPPNPVHTDSRKMISATTATPARSQRISPNSACTHGRVG